MHIKNIHEQFCEYQTAFKGYQKDTIAGYKSSLNVFLICHPQVEYVTDVTDMLVQEFFYWGRRVRKWKPVTFVTYHKNMMPFFDYAVKNGFIDNNTFAKVEKPCIGKTLPKALTKQQAREILDVALHKSTEIEFGKLRNHAIYALFLHAGLRKNKVIKLCIYDVDMMNHRLSIREAKGNKDRMVPISSGLHTILNRYVSARQKAGYTFATLMLDGGCNIYTLSKMMGHSDIKTTTIYLSTSRM